MILTNNTEAVVVDADDTLWLDAVYFRRLLGGLRELLPPDCDHKLAADIVENELGRKKPGESGFVDAVMRIAEQLGIRHEPGSQLDLLISQFDDHPMTLLPDVTESLRILKIWRLILVTKGVQAEQARKIERSGLRDLFDSVFIVAQKNSIVLGDILKSEGLRAEHVVSIGNSIKHDVVPAVELGSTAIWLNHPDNFYGRNAPLPDSAFVAAGWRSAIHLFRKLLTNDHLQRDGSP